MEAAKAAGKSVKDYVSQFGRSEADKATIRENLNAMFRQQRAQQQSQPQPQQTSRRDLPMQFNPPAAQPRQQQQQQQQGQSGSNRFSGRNDSRPASGSSSQSDSRPRQSGERRVSFAPSTNTVNQYQTEEYSAYAEEELYSTGYQPVCNPCAITVASLDLRAAEPSDGTDQPEATEPLAPVCGPCTVAVAGSVWPPAARS